jgi:predicted HTH transcriptional regulator
LGNTLHTLIDQGEHLQLDFKYCISDSRKIARSISAFSNTEGGTLLIGVKDNGNIAGVQSEEEYYMIEAAANMYSKPVISPTINQHKINGKVVLEVLIEKAERKPVYAMDESGRWIAYIRNDDQNLAVNRIILNVWRREIGSKGLKIKYTKHEKMLLDYLNDNKIITLSKYRRISRLPARKAEKIIEDFILCGIIKFELSEKGCTYVISDELPEID